MNIIHEKEIATGFQKSMSFGLIILGGLAGGIIGIIQILTGAPVPTSVLWMTVGGFFNFVTGLPIYLSFRKGIVYGVQ